MVPRTAIAQGYLFFRLMSEPSVGDLLSQTPPQCPNGLARALGATELEGVDAEALTFLFLCLFPPEKAVWALYN